MKTKYVIIISQSYGMWEATFQATEATYKKVLKETLDKEIKELIEEGEIDQQEPIRYRVEESIF